MVWKKEVFQQEILPEAPLNTVFSNINIEKQKLYQWQVLISVSATEAAHSWSQARQGSVRTSSCNPFPASILCV